MNENDRPVGKLASTLTVTSSSLSYYSLLQLHSNFCSTCNRLRLTADGKIKLCLFGEDSLNLKDLIRGN